MRITNIHNAASMGSFKEFKKLYKPYLFSRKTDINSLSQFSKMNVLQLSLCNSNINNDEKVEFVKFIVKESINVNYAEPKEKKLLYICFTLKIKMHLVVSIKNLQIYCLTMVQMLIY